MSEEERASIGKMFIVVFVFIIIILCGILYDHHRYDKRFEVIEKQLGIMRQP